MKTLKSKLFILSVITLVLTGCMPDSLTKYKKDPPKKEKPVVPDTEGPVVDDSGTAIAFDEPTVFSFVTEEEGLGADGTMGTVTSTPGDPIYISTGEEADVNISIDGSLGDPDKVSRFFERCDLMTTGVNAEAASLPAGLSLNTSSCVISGVPTTPKSVITAFCTDGVTTDPAVCETTPLVWNSVSSTCSVPDLEYATQSKCLAGFNKWYAAGSVVPYRIRLKYHNSAGVQKSIYSTLLLGAYKALTTLNYTQAEKVLLKVTSTDSTPPYINSVTPLLTTTATVGAYAKNNMLITSTNVNGVVKFVDVNQNYIGVNKLIPIKVASTAPFTVNTFVSVKGDASYVGKIFKIDVANRVLYVENISASNKYFTTADRLCANNITGVCVTSYAISGIEENYIYKINSQLDNDKQYYLEKFRVTTPTNVFEVGATIKPLRPISSTEISSANGISYSISPALPCNDPDDPADCISFDSSTGEMTGTFSGTLANTEFTITASNPMGEVSTTVNLSAIEAPTKLAYTNKQVITVASTAMFKEGETVIQPITPPLVDAISGRVIKIIDNYRMAIETFNGTFSQNASLDNNSSAFQAEKTYILPYSSCANTNYTNQVDCEDPAEGNSAWAPAEDIHYNLALLTSNTGSYVVGDTVTSNAGLGLGAFGRVMFIETSAFKDTLYIQYLTGTSTATTASKTFYEGDDLDKGPKVDQVLNGTMIITLDNLPVPPAPPYSVALPPATFIKGSDIVTSNSTAAYTNSVSLGNKTLSLSEISKTTSGTFLKIGDTVYNHEKQSEANFNADITAVTHANHFIFERGKKMVLNAAIASGSGIIYSISPALPSGLTIDSLTGIISGVANNASVKKDYLITATNFTGSTTHVVAFEVKDFFEVIEKSGASSALMHKVGDFQVNRKCRIDASDISSLSNGKALDIRCFLDMEEEDIFETNIKLNLFTGPGICQYIRYEPYYFYGWQPHQTTGTSTRYPEATVIRSGCDALASSGELPTAELCEGNYQYYDNTYPNCDEGKLTYYIESYAQANPDTSSGACTLTGVTTMTVNCGGKKSACISGAVKDVIDTESLVLGKRNEIISTSSGVDKTYNHASPISKGDSQLNLRTANGTTNNQCFSSAAETLTWKNATAAQSNLKATPFAADSNPFYTVTCLDAAYDVKARIRVIVRDWDKSFRIDSDVYNQSYLAPAANMNNNTLDPIFSKAYNDFSDWDDAFAGVGTAAVYTASTCATQAASNCTIASGPFMSDLDCTSAGGTVVVPGSCSAGGFTSYRTCVSAGVCSNPALTDSGTCAHDAGGETWTAYTWTAPTCRFTNQNQCEYYGGAWLGPQQYKFPAALLND